MSTELEERPNPAAADDGTEEDDDPPLLSSQALEALREFLSEQSSLGGAVEGRGDGGGDEPDEVRLVAEDWRLSQFWYDRDTAQTVAEEIRTLYRSTSSRIACIACPTLYANKLLEYDKRFEQYDDDFIYYDYNQPEELLPSLKHNYQVIIADPPYLRAAELLNVHPCGFRPQHTNKLGNEFRLFTNYDTAGRLGGWERKA
ncbi:hypothetical protein BHM03_00014992 [Ensete ventricosum]|uniref:Protein-lysine N-methyltransferase n=1 Tax=Ensete ventricosum TaxID=4639 RepID=A0A445MEI8_ENSVE|nr:hypothetical protein BHM03_00014992 [Ensete ventricosum]